MVEIVGCSTAHPAEARPMPDRPSITRGQCPMCGPFHIRQGATTQVDGPICPTCGMTPGEHAYRLRILADSAAVYAQEVREFNAKRDRSKAVAEATTPREVLRALGFEDVADQMGY